MIAGRVHTKRVNVNRTHELPDADEEDADTRYADIVNAPLSPETIEALRKQLESGEYARYRRPRKDDR